MALQPRLIPSGGGFGVTRIPGGQTGYNPPIPAQPRIDTGSQGVTTPLGAGQGPGTQGTGQASDNPFSNSFFFQIPQPSGSLGTASTGGTASMTGTGGSGWTQYLPLIVVGVITAGIAYYAFERRKK